MILSRLDGKMQFGKWTVILFVQCKGLKGKASIPTGDLIPKTRRGRNQHSKAFQTPLLIQAFISVASSPRLSGIGMSSQIFLSHLL